MIINQYSILVENAFVSGIQILLGLCPRGLLGASVPQTPLPTIPPKYGYATESVYRLASIYIHNIFFTGLYNNVAYAVWFTIFVGIAVHHFYGLTKVK